MDPRTKVSTIHTNAQAKILTEYVQTNVFSQEETASEAETLLQKPQSQKLTILESSNIERKS